MKREVSPWIVVVGILLTLTIVQVVYYQHLVRPPATMRVGPAGGGGSPGGEGEGPTGVALCEVSTAAGQGEAGCQDGPAAQARFDGPAAVAVAADGTVFIADSRNHRICELTPQGQVRTLAGAPTGGAVGGYADGTGPQARFAAPAGIAIAPDGSLLVADTGNHRLRRVTRTGVVTTFAGDDTPKDDLGRPQGGHRDGPPAQAQFRFPVGLAVDSSGVAYVADAGNGCVRRVPPTGEVGTVAAEGGEMAAPTQVALGPDGSLWVADTVGGRLWTGPRAGPLRPWSGGKGAPKGPAGLAIVGGALYVVDSKEHVLLRAEGERFQVVAGQQGKGAGYADGPGYLAGFASPAGLARSPGGELYVADFGNHAIRRVRLLAAPGRASAGARAP